MRRVQLASLFGPQSQLALPGPAWCWGTAHSTHSHPFEPVASHPSGATSCGSSAYLQSNTWRGGCVGDSSQGARTEVARWLRHAWTAVGSTAGTVRHTTTTHACAHTRIHAHSQTRARARTVCTPARTHNATHASLGRCLQLRARATERARHARGRPRAGGAALSLHKTRRAYASQQEPRPRSHVKSPVIMTRSIPSNLSTCRRLASVSNVSPGSPWGHTTKMERGRASRHKGNA